MLEQRQAAAQPRRAVVACEWQHVVGAICVIPEGEGGAHVADGRFYKPCGRRGREVDAEPMRYETQREHQWDVEEVGLLGL